MVGKFVSSNNIQANFILNLITFLRYVCIKTISVVTSTTSSYKIYGEYYKKITDNQYEYNLTIIILLYGI